ncbi:MAG: hypothetical protein QXE90_03360 [Candidatus Micrarchaeia archaeon]
MAKNEEFDWEKWGKAWDKSWRRRKNESLVWTGLIVLLIGVLWYAVTVGLIDLGLVCPGFLIIIGAMFILKGLLDQIFHF